MKPNFVTYFRDNISIIHYFIIHKGRPDKYNNYLRQSQIKININIHRQYNYIY